MNSVVTAAVIISGLFVAMLVLIEAGRRIGLKRKLEGLSAFEGAGFGLSAGARRSWLHAVCFAATLTVAFFVIVDLEYPRVGLVRIDWMHGLSRDWQNGMW